MRTASVKAVVEAGVAVMGHIGLTPQSISVLGGFSPQGKTAAAALKAVRDAKVRSSGHKHRPLCLQVLGACRSLNIPFLLWPEVARRPRQEEYGVRTAAVVAGACMLLHVLKRSMRCCCAASALIQSCMAPCRRWRTRAASPWCWSACPTRCQLLSPPSSAYPPLALALEAPAAAR